MILMSIWCPSTCFCCQLSHFPHFFLCNFLCNPSSREDLTKKKHRGNHWTLGQLLVLFPKLGGNWGEGIGKGVFSIFGKKNGGGIGIHGILFCVFFSLRPPTLPSQKFSSSPLKSFLPNGKVVFQPPFFRAMLNFGGVAIPKKRDATKEMEKKQVERLIDLDFSTSLDRRSCEITHRYKCFTTNVPWDQVVYL